MIIIIDNYDSFTYNLYQYIGEINPDILVYRNDKCTPEEILAQNPSHIIISPGPGYPNEAGICIDLIKQNKSIPMLGVCLGHQAIVEAFGGHIIHAPRVMHGKDDVIKIDNTQPIFCGLPEKITVGRYHSLVAENDSVPACLQVIAKSDDDCIMGVAHKEKPIYGIQFHPESVLTPDGKTMIRNFLSIHNK